ncbi:MAG: hypothetical protein JWQ56_3484 [Pseudarthrobacter sp.]|nr:hypothetical protein [Pseudarthrobacter sp.]
MGTNRKQAHYQAGAGDEGSGTTGFHGQSPVPITPGPLLNLRSNSDQESLQLLALAAASELPEPGSYMDCVVSLPRPGPAFLTAGTHDRAVGIVQADQENGQGPVSHALEGRRSGVVNSSSTVFPWPAYSGHMGEAGYRAMLSAPLALVSGGFAALTLLADTDEAFPSAVLSRLTKFSAVAATSYAMAAQFRAAGVVVNQLQASMQDRTSIEVACGVIMGRNRCSYEEALKLLADASTHRNVQARVVADRLLSQLPGGVPAPHFGR